jgi:hypothetical protein
MGNLLAVFSKSYIPPDDIDHPVDVIDRKRLDLILTEKNVPSEYMGEFLYANRSFSRLLYIHQTYGLPEWFYNKYRPYLEEKILENCHPMVDNLLDKVDRLSEEGEVLDFEIRVVKRELGRYKISPPRRRSESRIENFSRGRFC